MVEVHASARIYRWLRRCANQTPKLPYFAG
jgi:hypothetical protein